MKRPVFVALALVTIAFGLTIYGGGIIDTPWLRDVVGDALWAVMLFWCVGAFAPMTLPSVRALVTLAACFAVEASQLLHTPALDAIRRTSAGHLVLGSDFYPRDLAAYTAGVAFAFLIERVFLSRLARP